MNIEQARFNMVEQQVRTWEVLDQAVLDLMERAPRDAFTPQDYRRLAYADICVPLAHGQVMMPPRVEARALQALRLDAADRVLEIGTGSGYFTYLLAALAGHVVSMEIHEDLLQEARRRLEQHSVFNVTLDQGDGARGRAAGAPYDAIAVTVRKTGTLYPGVARHLKFEFAKTPPEAPDGTNTVGHIEVTNRGSGEEVLTIPIRK